MSLAVIGGLLAYFMIGFWLWHSVPARLSPSFSIFPSLLSKKGSFPKHSRPHNFNISTSKHLHVYSHFCLYSHPTIFQIHKSESGRRIGSLGCSLSSLFSPEESKSCVICHIDHFLVTCCLKDDGFNKHLLIFFLGNTG